MLEDLTPRLSNQAPGPRFLDHDGPFGMAHRGGAGEAPASSPQAVARTAALGFYLEADISVTPDGVPVLFHPRGPARLATWRPLSSDPAAYRLTDVLTEHPSLRVMIDVKQWPAVAPTAIAIARTGAAERISIGTFSQSRTDATARAVFALTGVRVWTALGLARIARLALGQPIRGDRHTAQLPYRLITPRFVSRAHAASVKVIAWTVDDEARMHRLLAMGVDGIITDHPSRLQRVLEQRSDP